MNPKTQTRDFWIDRFQGRAEQAMIFSEEDEEEENEDYELEEDQDFQFPINERYTLKLTGGIIEEFFLRDAAEQEEFKLGWDDESHWHPHCLRWKELIAISQHVGTEDANIAVLLLAPFAPICNDGDAAVAHPALKKAWESLNLFTDDEIQRWIDTFDTREGNYQWRQNERGDWYMYQAPEDSERHWFPLYSLRTEEDADFPWQQWQEVCRICQVDACEPESGPFAFNKYFNYDIRFDVTSLNQWSTEACIERFIILLYESGYGGAQQTGRVLTRDLGCTSISVSAQVRNDPRQFGIVLQKVLAEFPDVTVAYLGVSGAESRPITLEEILGE
ncbi:MAG: hypothetical protein QM758_19855 [Armatimonas sp.]